MQQFILFTFLVLFPFGQIIKIGFINPVDVVVGIGAVWAIFKKFEVPAYFKYVKSFLLVCLFSWIIGALYFKDIKVLYGLMYLIRLASYFYFSIFIFHYKKFSNIYLNALISVTVVTTVFAWIQYFWFPDLKPFMIYGWDDHLYRLVGTFLDPGYLGIILVIGSLVAFYQKKYFVFIFLALSILFTYSRASYLAFLAATPFVIGNFKKYLFIVTIFLLLISILPRQAGEGVKLERTASSMARIDNYQETFEIFKTSPVFGIGFNNMCIAKNSDFSSHSCSGSDSSLLFILATSGIVGLISFLYLIYGIWQSIKTDRLIFGTGIALGVHSLFHNTLFYPFVLGLVMILIGVNSKTKANS